MVFDGVSIINRERVYRGDLKYNMDEPVKTRNTFNIKSN